MALTRDFKAMGQARLRADPKFRSALLKAVHDTADGLNQAGVMDAATRRAFDQLCKLPSKKPIAGRKQTPSKYP